jgi:intein/homing endonuclease
MFDDSLKNIEDIKVGELVKTLNGSKPVTHIWDPSTLENGTPECYEIEFEDGYKCVVSENHPFLTTQGWIEAKNLNLNNEVVAL